MNDSAQVNQVYLIFNRPQFLVDSSNTYHILTFKFVFFYIQPEFIWKKNNICNHSSNFVSWREISLCND